METKKEIENRKKNIKLKNPIFTLISIFVLLIVLIMNINFTSAQTTAEVKSCCERTTYGAWCMNAPENECDSGLRKTPTSCEATSFCKLGCCYDSSEGICMESTPQKVCDLNKGTWAADKECNIPQCQLGCCVIGTQAAFVTLTRCKKLSSFYGLQVDFRNNIGNELECISLASLSDEGACVYDVDYIKTCKFTSRQACNTLKSGVKVEEGVAGGAVTSNVTFNKDLLCSAEELGTNCAMTKETTCVDGKDEVYFKDSCGNIANIYDSGKVSDKDYWRKKISKTEACNSNNANINNPNCGNCNYLSGSLCGTASRLKTSPKYGNAICRDLNCKDTTDGPKKHGESWCSTDNNKDSVGSRYFRHLCISGEEIVEPCVDFRNEQCIEDDINGFSQAACRVNRWQDCLSQTEKIDCENTDKRDCIWQLKGKDEVETKTTEQESEIEGVSGTFATQKPVITEIACVPEHAPGLKFWAEGEAQGICSLANNQCVVTYEKTGLIFSGKEKCTENCECLGDSWKQENLKKCESLGDCGAKVNYIGIKGFDKGYKISIKKVETPEEAGGGLLGIGLVLNKFGITGKAVDVQVKDIEKQEVV